MTPQRPARRLDPHWLKQFGQLGSLLIGQWRRFGDLAFEICLDSSGGIHLRLMFVVEHGCPLSRYRHEKGPGDSRGPDLRMVEALGGVSANHGNDELLLDLIGLDP
jgi:hypothetical protein